ncbi:uncharacterized protein LOC125657493 isoform X2 [Ostrea edulis]|uniref:uncharacterized protein LOC125657493 isoform X2 n=1 Tax=Ostrea edulis TaxID=37623 RepID=UPI0024AEB3D1|nr:uncharacterized protein LOC125657493 isoform X2 [Ostrea edulis]
MECECVHIAREFERGVSLSDLCMVTFSWTILYSMVPFATEQNNGVPNRDKQSPGDTTKSASEDDPNIVQEERTLIYKISDATPIHLTLFFAMQQALLSLSTSLAVSLLVAEYACAEHDEDFKSRLLSSTLFMNGITTLLMITIGVRLPLYQGATPDYVAPLVAMAAIDKDRCNMTTTFFNATSNTTEVIATNPDDIVIYHIQTLQGSLMLAGVIHCVLGATGLVGVLLRFIGPVTIVPTILLIGIYMVTSVTKFAQVHWGISFMTCAIAIIMSLYLSKHNMPIPVWTRKKSCHVIKYPFHQVFAILIAIVIGWIVSIILTESGVFDSATSVKDKLYYARTDARSYVITNAKWFQFPYPGQFGTIRFSINAFVGFFIATIVSILDSIGDYYACATTCRVPPPPSHAVNRGIAVEGLCTTLSGAVGCGHGTTTYGGNIGAIGLTKVASRHVFVCVALVYILFGIIGKFSAIFITIPHPVLGGALIIMFGMFNGVVLSNLQSVDLTSTRNSAIIGTSLLVGLMMPHWIERYPDTVNTGNPEVDDVLKMLLGNPNMVGAVLSCFLDNTVPGTPEERGITAWQTVDEETLSSGIYQEGFEVYKPWQPSRMANAKFMKYVPFMPDPEKRVPERQLSVDLGRRKKWSSGIVFMTVQLGFFWNMDTGSRLLTDVLMVFQLAAININTGPVDTEQNNEIPYRDKQSPGDTTKSASEDDPDIVQEERTLIYKISDATPIHLTLFFAMQQALLSLSTSLAVSLLVAEYACAEHDEDFKSRLLSSTLFMNGITTLLMITIGVRLPLYQGATPDYVAPLVAMAAIDKDRCNMTTTFFNATSNTTEVIATNPDDVIIYHIQTLQGSLMLAGVIHCVVGATGLVGVLLRFIGPVTIVPTILLIGIYMVTSVTKFAQVHWGISSMTCAIAIIMSLYLSKHNMPIPMWTRKKSCHVIRYPFHQVFAILIAIVIGWIVSIILTESGVFDSATSVKDKLYYARTDARSYVITNAKWFQFPYPGQFGTIRFSINAFVGFFIATIVSILDSIGDYYACATTCRVPPPPPHAVNRGIAVEGLCTTLSGAVGCGHGTTTYGGNIGAVGLTRVASRHVFVCVALVYILFGIIGKFSAIFITIPHPVLGGALIIMFGMFNGVVLSNLQSVDLTSTRNSAIIGTSLLVGLMIPHWIGRYPDTINTGNPEVDDVIKMLLGNPNMVGAILSCFLDNTVPGTPKERGIAAWQTVDEETMASGIYHEGFEVYKPWQPSRMANIDFMKYVPFMPNPEKRDPEDKLSVDLGREKNGAV